MKIWEPLINPAVALEFYPGLLLNIYIIIILYKRKQRIITAAHMLHNDFPKSSKIKLIFLFFWSILILSLISLLWLAQFYPKISWL